MTTKALQTALSFKFVEVSDNRVLQIELSLKFVEGNDNRCSADRTVI